MATKRPTPSFVIRLTGGEISPERVPLRILSDAASAITRLAIGGADESESKSVRVLGVKRGSAVYPCLMETENETHDNLSAVGKVIEDPHSDLLTHTMLRPIDRLAKIAASLECQIQIQLPGTSKALATITSNSYQRIRGVALMHDEATVNGYLVRVGGASDRKCAIRVYGRDRLLICQVDTEDLSRQLGKHLYEPVTVYGRGLYFSRTWDLIHLRIDKATFSSNDDYDKMMDEFRAAGGDAWDDCQDVDGELRSMR